MRLLNAALLVALAGVLVAPTAHAQAAKGKATATAKAPAKPPSEMAQAKSHLAEAIKEGKAGKADGVVTHAQMALEHAQATDKEKSTENTQAAIKSLQEAIDQGKAGKAPEATKAAQAALDHLNMKAGGSTKKAAKKKA
jgi:hypothetical protein